MNRIASKRSAAAKVVFMFDVDHTLLDNDRVIADLRTYLRSEVGPARARAYWSIFERLRTRLGYADYLGALQRYRIEYPHELRLLAVSRFLINYPFANRLFPNSLDVIEHVKQWGAAVSHRRRCRLPTPQSGPLRTLRSGQWARADLRAQGARIGRRGSSVSGGSLCNCGRQGSYPGGHKENLGSAGDNGLREAGTLRSGSKDLGIPLTSRRKHRAHW